jgi:pimeloyl-ACP methyl ester carboxylesterase
VFTPTLTGQGERKHLISKDITLETAAQDVINVIEYEELRDVYLVGHSFGGQIAALVTDRVPEKIKRLVFLDGGWPENGRSVFDSLPPDVRASRYKTIEEKGGGVGVPVVDASLFGVTDPEQAAWVNRRLTPQPAGTYTQPAKMSNPVGNGRPVTFIRATAPRFGSVDQYEELAKKQPSWERLEIACGHDAMVVKPAEVASLLLGVA